MIGIAAKTGPRSLGRVLLILLASLFGAGIDADSGTNSTVASTPARLLKVLPLYLDLQGRPAINPSLFDRDAYQFELRKSPERRSGLRFEVLWKAPKRYATNVTLKLELRGSKAPAQSPVVVTVTPRPRRGSSRWTRVPVLGRDYEALGELLAWRASLWKENELIAELTSFLWEGSFR